MATVTGYTAERMGRIEAASIVNGDVIDGRLILTNYGGGSIDAGNVQGPQGETGLTPSLTGTSRSSVALGTGTKIFSISPSMNVPFPVGSIVRAVSTARATDYIAGVVTAATVSSITMTAIEFGGVGTPADWVIAIGALGGLSDEQVRTRIGGQRIDLGTLTGTVNMSTVSGGALTSDSLMNAFLNARLIGNVVINTANMPSGLRKGTIFYWAIQQDAVGSRRLSFAPSVQLNGSIAIASAAGAISLVEFVYDGALWWVTTLGNYAFIGS